MTDNLHSEPSPRNTILAFVIVIIALLGGVIVLLSSRPQPLQITIHPPVPTSTPAPTSTFAPITVYVTGAVQKPQQTITLPYRSRVQDALTAVGGTTSAADMDKVNLADYLHDGDQVHVPVKGSCEAANANRRGSRLAAITRLATSANHRRGTYRCSVMAI